MNEQDEEYEMMKLGAEVIKERIDKVDELEKRIDSLENKLIAVLASFEVISGQGIRLTEICGEMNERLSEQIRQLEFDVSRKMNA